MSTLPLPNEILVSIFRLLPFDDVISSSSVCRRFHDVIASNRKYMKKLPVHLNIEPMTEPSIRVVLSSLSGNIYHYVKIHIRENGSNNCSYEHDNKPCTAWYILRQYFATKEISNDNSCQLDRGSDRFVTSRWLDYEPSNQVEEMRQLFSFLNKTFKIQNISSGDNCIYYHTKFDDMIQSFANNGSETSSIPMYIRRVTPQHVKLYQMLNSNLVQVDCNEHELPMLDTNFEIHTGRCYFSEPQHVGVLIKEWNSNIRNIKKFVARRSNAPYKAWDLTILSLKEFMETEFHSHHLTVEQETKSQIRFSLRRRSDLRILSVNYANHPSAVEHVIQYLCIEERY